jgi:hypothetical protein
MAGGGVAPGGPNSVNMSAPVAGPKQSGAAGGGDLVKTGQPVDKRGLGDIRRSLIEKEETLNMLREIMKTEHIPNMKEMVTQHIADEMKTNHPLTNSAKEVFDLFVSFEDKHPNTKITFKRFIKLCNDILPTPKDT